MPQIDHEAHVKKVKDAVKGAKHKDDAIRDAIDALVANAAEIRASVNESMTSAEILAVYDEAAAHLVANLDALKDLATKGK